jgi:hypothetical protein
MNRAKFLFSRFLLILIGIILALGVMEVGLRLLRAVYPIPHAEDPSPWAQYVGWARGPYLMRWAESRDGSRILLRYNSVGLRDVEHRYEKPPGVYRILVLGDSFAEAKEVELEQVFTRALEKLLNERLGSPELRYEVINGGVGAWGTDQELLFYLYEGYRYAPDIVLLDFTPNDVINNYQPIESLVEREPDGVVHKPYFVLEDGRLSLKNFPYVEAQPPLSGTPDGFLYNNSVAYRVFEGAWGDFRENLYEKLRERGVLPPKEKNGGKQLGAYNPGLYIYEDRDMPEVEAAWQLTAAILERLKVEAESRGARLVVVANSTDFAVHPQAWEEYSKGEPELQQHNWDWDRPYRRLTKILQEQSIPYLSLEAPFVQHAMQTGELLHFLKDGHWTPGGHSLAAKLTCDWLIEQRLVPVQSRIQSAPTY